MTALPPRASPVWPKQLRRADMPPGTTPCNRAPAAYLCHVGYAEANVPCSSVGRREIACAIFNPRQGGRGCNRGCKASRVAPAARQDPGCHVATPPGINALTKPPPRVAVAVGIALELWVRLGPLNSNNSFGVVRCVCGA